MIRNDFSHPHRRRELFHQFLVDQFAKIEEERLAYIRSHETELRVDQYQHLCDPINNDHADAENTGRLVILPSSHTGGPRYMHQRIQNAMMYVRKYGNPSLFITFTCNPHWPGIKAELFLGQAPCNRLDLIARIFKRKLKVLMDLLTKHCIFDKKLADMYTIKWQKRGLPHAYVLLWLKDKVHASQIDSIISAEFPNPGHDSQLFVIVKSHMIHGPCGPFNPQCKCMQVIQRGERHLTLYEKTIQDHFITRSDR